MKIFQQMQQNWIHNNVSFGNQNYYIHYDQKSYDRKSYGFNGYYYSYWENEQDVESKWQATMVKYRYYNSDWYHYNLLNRHYSNHPFVFKKTSSFSSPTR